MIYILCLTHPVEFTFEHTFSPPPLQRSNPRNRASISSFSPIFTSSMEKKKREEKERESVEENRGCSRMIPRVPRCGSFSTLFGKTNSSAAAARNELRKKRVVRLFHGGWRERARHDRFSTYAIKRSKESFPRCTFFRLMKLRASSRLEEATLAKISPYFIEEIYERNI